MDIRNAYFFPCDGTRGGSKALGNVGKVWGNIKSTFGTTFVIGVWLKWPNLTKGSGYLQCKSGLLGYTHWMMVKGSFGGYIRLISLQDIPEGPGVQLLFWTYDPKGPFLALKSVQNGKNYHFQG